MRGPQVRVVSVADATSAQAEAKKKAGPLPELRYNVRLLLDLAEVKIQNTDRRMQQEQDQLSLLKQEKERVGEQVKFELKRIQLPFFDDKWAMTSKGIDRLQEILEIIAKCQELVKAGELQLDNLKSIFEMLRNKYKEEYVMHKLKYVALELVGPLVCSQFFSFLLYSGLFIFKLKNVMLAWDPLIDPAFGASIFSTFLIFLQIVKFYD